MMITVRGHAQGPAVAVVGNWDPLVPAHRTLFRSLVRAARRSRRSAVAILLHPNPVGVLYGLSRWPAYDHVEARIGRLRALGVNGVVKVAMSRRNLDLGAAELFAALRPHVDLAEVWLGARQTLGPGPAGSVRAVARAIERRGGRLRVLPSLPRSSSADAVRALLGRGAFDRAVRVVGHPPVWRRPSGDLLRLNWPAGWYDACALRDATEEPGPPTLRLRLRRRDAHGAFLEWPDRSIRWLAFLKGPSGPGR